MAGSEAGFVGTFEKAGSWLSSGISSIGQRTRTMATPSTSSAGMRVFQPRNTTSIVISKGLTNAPGENNCFLNSAVQVLWHLDVFRRSFRDMTGHACMGKACIFCALKVLFTQLQYGEEKALPPDALRKALASAFKDEQRFQLRCMDDAAECFENILVRIHFHLAHDVKEDMCDAKHCVSHQKFAMTLIEHCVCPCGATSEPFPFTQMVHYVSCTALCGEAKKQKERHHLSSGSAFFGQLLRSAGAIGDVRACPSECGKKVHIRRVLMNCPDVVGIGLVWDSDRPSVDHIMDVISCLGTTLRLPDLFNSVVDDQAKEVALNLVGVVTYYGKHYSTFFYNTRRKLWIYFDDASVKQVGPNWRDVAERCRRGHFQPLLLLYANRSGTAVDVSTAPKETHILPGYQNLESPDKPPASSFSSGHHRSKSTPSHSGGRLDSTGAVYKPLSSVPEFSVRSSETDGPMRNKWDSVVEIGHDAVGGLTNKMQHQLSLDRERSQDIRTLTRQNQQKALAMAGFDCSKEYQDRSNATSINQASGFIETRGMPQPLLGGNYNNQKYSGAVISRTAEPTDLIGQYDADTWARSNGSKTLPRPGVLQASKAGTRYQKGIRKPQNGGGAPQSNSETTRTLFESNQNKLVRHKSWNGRSDKSVPIYENVVDGAIASDEVDNAEGNVTLQSRHTNYNSTPDLQRNLSNSTPQQVLQHSYYDTDNQLNDRKHTDSPALNRFGSQPDLQKQNLNSQESEGITKRKASLTKSASADSDIYGSMPNLQRTLTTPVSSSTQHIAPQGILADAIKNDQENRRIMSSAATLQSNSSSSPDSKRSSQASQASTYTVDSADTSRSSGSSKSTGSLRSKYGIASGFVTLPRKKRISDFAEGSNPQQDRVYQQTNMRQFMQRSQSDPPLPVSHGHSQIVLQQQNSAPAQFAGVFIDDDEGISPTPTARQPSHLQHLTPSDGKRTDPLEEGSVGSKDSGYRSSRDRSSASSGSVYSVDSPTADTPPMPIPQNFGTSPDTARQNVEGMCLAVGIDVDELLDKCHEKETEGDLAMALCLCTSAVTKLKSTVKMSGMSDATRHYLQTKYNTSVIRSRSLHKRLQIARQTQRQDSLEGVIDDRPTSVLPSNSRQQPARPASTPITYNPQPNQHPIPQRSHHINTSHHSSYNTQPSNGTHQREHRPVQHMYSTPSHATDPRTGQYRPHSAQLPRKQYDFNASSQQGYPRHQASGNSIGDRYRRSSEGGENGPWGSGAPNTSRNPPRRTVVEVLTTHTTQPSREAHMSDPFASDHLGDDTVTTSLQRDLVSKRSSVVSQSSGRNSDNSPTNNSQHYVAHSRSPQIHAPVQFTDLQSTKSSDSKIGLTSAGNITKHGEKKLDHNYQHQNTNAKSNRMLDDGSKSSKKDLNQRMTVELEEFGCSAAKGRLPAKPVGCSSAKGSLPANPPTAKSRKRGKPVRYVIEIHTMKTIPECDIVNGGSCKNT